MFARVNDIELDNRKLKVRFFSTLPISEMRECVILLILTIRNAILWYLGRAGPNTEETGSCGEPRKLVSSLRVLIFLVLHHSGLFPGLET